MLVCQLCLSLCDTTDYSLPGSSARGVLQVRILELGSHSLLQGISQPGIKPVSALQIDSLLSEPQGSSNWLKEALNVMFSESGDLIAALTLVSVACTSTALKMTD